MKKTSLLAVLTVFNLLFYYSMRSFWSGIEGMFGVWWLSYLLFIVIAALVVFSIILRLTKRANAVLFWVAFGLSIAITGGLGYNVLSRDWVASLRVGYFC